MAASLKYSFDTSAWLNGRRDLLRPAIFPTLWVKIEGLIDEGAIRSVDEVRHELSRRDDEVHGWTRSHSHLFLPLDEDVQAETKAILREHPRLLGNGRGRNGADPFVIALARVHGACVVTEEKPRNLVNPKIPDVCDVLAIPCMTLIDFVQAEGWTF